MGENKHINELDAFAKKYIKELPKEKLSKEFTFTLLQQLEAENKIETLKKKALISKKAWIVIIIGILAAVFIPFKENSSSIFTIPKNSFTFLSDFQLSKLFSSLSISNVMVYAICLFGIMLIAQIVYLKKYFENRTTF